jgi:hypothetical protein
VALLLKANYLAWHLAMEAFASSASSALSRARRRSACSYPDAQSNDELPPQAALNLNGQITLEYQKQLSAYRECEEKAAGNILAHLSCSKQMHIKDKGSDAKGI